MDGRSLELRTRELRVWRKQDLDDSINFENLAMIDLKTIYDFHAKLYDISNEPYALKGGVFIW